MNLDDMEKLKFDRRLEQRRDWVAPGEREAHLESLSDAASKIYDGRDEPEEAAASSATAGAPHTASAAPPAPQPEAPAPPAAPVGGLGEPTS